MQIVSALFVENFELREAPGPSTRIDLSGVFFSMAAPAPAPVSIEPHLVALIWCPPEEEGHIRNLLADSLQGIVHQELLPTVDKHKRVAAEILLATDAVRNVIRRRGTFMLRSIIQTGSKLGMCTMVQSVKALLEEGAIAPEVAETILYNYSL